MLLCSLQYTFPLSFASFLVHMPAAIIQRLKVVLPSVEVTSHEKAVNRSGLQSHNWRLRVSMSVSPVNHILTVLF